MENIEINNTRESVPNDSSKKLLEDLNSNSGIFAKEPSPGLYVVCEDNKCVPFSTRESGTKEPVSFLQENFAAFDRDSNGFVNKQELDRVANHFKKGTGVRKMIDALSRNEGKIDDLSNDEYFTENDGITVKDLSELDKLTEKDTTKLSTRNQELLRDLVIKPGKEELERMARERKFDGSELEEALMVSAETDRDLVMKFGASWCGPCRVMENTTWKDESLSSHMKKNSVALNIDIDRNPEIAEKYGVTSVPTVLVGKVTEDNNGDYTFEPKQRFSSYLSAENLRQALK